MSSKDLPEVPAVQRDVTEEPPLKRQRQETPKEENGGEVNKPSTPHEEHHQKPAGGGNRFQILPIIRAIQEAVEGDDTLSAEMKLNKDPASDIDLQKIRDKIQVPFPTAYEEFLKVHDGGYVFDFWLPSAEEILEQWDYNRCFPGVYKECKAFPFGMLDYDFCWRVVEQREEESSVRLYIWQFDPEGQHLAPAEAADKVLSNMLTQIKRYRRVSESASDLLPKLSSTEGSKSEEERDDDNKAATTTSNTDCGKATAMPSCGLFADGTPIPEQNFWNTNIPFGSTLIDKLQRSSGAENKARIMICLRLPE